MKKAILGCFYILFILSFFLFITPINAQNDEEESAPIVEPTPAPTIEPTTPPAEEPAPTPQAEEATPAPTEEPTPEPTIEPAPTPQVEEPVPAPTEEPTPTPQAEEPAPTTTTEEPISSEEESAGIVGEDDSCAICNCGLFADANDETLTVLDIPLLSIDESSESIINPTGPIWSRVLSKTFKPKNQAEINKVKIYKKSLLKAIDKDIKLIKKGKKGKHVQSYKNNSDGSITVKLQTNNKKNKSKGLKNKKEATTKLRITCGLNPGDGHRGKPCKTIEYIKKLNRNGIPIEPVEFIRLPETIISSCNLTCATCDKPLSKENTDTGYKETFACRLKDASECSPSDGNFTDANQKINPDLGRESDKYSHCDNNCKIVCGKDGKCAANKSCGKDFDDKGFPTTTCVCNNGKDKNACTKNEKWDQENCSCYECKNNNDCTDNYVKKFCNIEKRTCYECTKDDDCDTRKCDLQTNTCICNENRNRCPSNIKIPDATYSCNTAYEDEEHPEGLRGLCERLACNNDNDCTNNPKCTKCDQATNKCVTP